MSDKEKLICSLEIVPYPDKVLLSKERRPVYYTKKDAPKRYIGNPRYYFNNNGVLIDASTLKPIVKNSRTAGKPRYWNVNFQSIWNGAMHQHARANISNKLSDMVRPSLDKCPVITQFPLRIELVICDILSKQDIDNKGVVYHKVFADTLKKLGKIPDDSVEYINDTGRTIFIKVDNTEDIGMYYNIYLNK